MLLNAVYLVAFVALLPWVAWRKLSGGRPVAAPWMRFTGGIPPLPRCDAGVSRIWFHGVSVGEVQLLSVLAAEIRRQADAAGLPVDCVISSSTTTGLDVAAKRFGTDHTFPCPLDFTWAVNRVLDRVRPDLLVLGELELWPNLLACAHARGIPIVVANARMSEKSAQLLMNQQL
jgi:3-deoxy-D-manno-octulosonic-acid transferase